MVARREHRELSVELALRRGADWLELPLRATPGASADAFAGVVEGVPRLRVCAKPVDGEANKAILRFLAKKVFGVAPSRLSLVAGEKGRDKRVRVEGDPAVLEAALRAALGGAKPG